MPRTPGEMLAMARAFLERKQIEEARLEAELLVAHALATDRLGLFMQLDRPLDGADVDAARDLLVRRGRREPVAYITGRREFYGRSFEVGPGVLIPRSETELLVDLARERCPDPAGRRAADLGCGSGCIAVTLALELPGLVVGAFDSSEEALACTRRNAECLGAELTLTGGDGLAGLEAAVVADGPFDLLLSNPPYVRPEERGSLAPEVRDYEPDEALFAPAGDPDRWVRELVVRARSLVCFGGVVLVELGVGQGPRAVALAAEAGLGATLHRDLAGIERVLEVEVEQPSP
ncbi:MAG: peptide chain release factor N(5)-glutamine methyltransferase [Planctomycetota bacterium]|nr:peptide chain release factor N(5)-glutamine methyltransferase [Planctomycetota bacterium]